MNTLWQLMAKYETPAVPVAQVCADFFAPLTLPKFLAKTSNGEIPLPIVRMTDTQKSPKYVNLTDLAKYIDDRTDAARRETNALGA